MIVQIRVSLACVVVTALAALLFFRSSGASQNTPARPDVILLTIDTLRADHLGCYGDARIQTPNLDRFAAAADRFAHAYSPVPITLPAHTSIMTGSYPMATGMHDFSGNKLSSDATTLAKTLRAQGYRTAAFVSAAVLDSRFGLDSGFDSYYDHFDFSRLDESSLDLIERPGDQTMNLALTWLDQQSSPTGEHKPFFLWVHLYDPHYPYTPPEPYATRYRDRLYDGEIAFADTQAGRLFAELKDRGFFDKSILVVTADHGEGLGEHGEKNHGFFIYNSTLHVPLMIKVPGIAPRVVHGDASLIDIMPTVLEALNVPAPSGVQGRSLLAEMEGRQDTASEAHRDLYAETDLPLLHFRWGNLRSIQTQDLKYVDAPTPELYDTRADPGELKNLAARRSAVAHELHSRLLSLIQQDTPGSGGSAQQVLTDPVLLARLRSLGYVATGSTFEDPQGKPLPDPKERVEVYQLFSDAMADGQHGRYQKSLQKLADAEKSEPRSLPIHYLMALDYYRLKDYPHAAARFKSALELDPKFALAAYYLGLTQTQMGDSAAAVESLQRSLDLDATNFSAAFDLGALLLKMNRVDDAVSAFQKAIAINPEYAKAHEALGEVYLYQKRVDAAAQELERTVQLQPGFAKAHYNLGRAYQALGKSDDAQREFDRAKEP